MWSSQMFIAILWYLFHNSFFFSKCITWLCLVTLSMIYSLLKAQIIQFCLFQVFIFHFILPVQYKEISKGLWYSMCNFIYLNYLITLWCSRSITPGNLIASFFSFDSSRAWRIQSGWETILTSSSKGTIFVSYVE